jgi:tRNA threonylcarbamoyladenosine biosynthesis protein TsaB
MIVLAIKTNEPKAEIGLFDDSRQLENIVWDAHLKLAETIHLKIKEMLDLLSISLDQLEGIVVFAGPGSFTGLRIGASVANALAYSQEIPIVGSTGETWIKTGIADLESGKNHKVVTLEYGQPPRTTSPRK